jgi:hypothetical protein
MKKLHYILYLRAVIDYAKPTPTPRASRAATKNQLFAQFLEPPADDQPNHKAARHTWSDLCRAHRGLHRMSENPKAKKTIRAAARPRLDDQATMVSELNFHQAFPISLPESWPTEESEEKSSDFRKTESSNTTPTTHFSLSEAESGDTNVSSFDEPVAPQDTDFAFPESNFVEQEVQLVTAEDSDFAFPVSDIEEQEVQPVATEDSDFAFPNTGTQMEQSSKEEEDSIAIPLSDYQLAEEIIENADEVPLSADGSSDSQTHSSLAIADDELIPITESGATEFQEEVTRVAALEAEVVHFDLAAAPVSLPHQMSTDDELNKSKQSDEHFINQPRFATTIKSIEESVVVVIESRNTSTREVSLTPSEFATAEQQILSNRIVHIPGKVLILDAVAIFRQIDPGISARRRRRTA